MKRQQLQQLQQFLARQYANARHYTNAVVGTGYAAFFATWGFTRDYLSAEVELTSVLLLLFSLTSFVGWEVFRTVRNGMKLREVGKIMADEPPEKIPRLLQKFGQRVNSSDVESLKWWWISVWCAIVPAVIALLLLGGSFLKELVSTVGLQGL